MPQDTNTATEHLALPQSKAASDVQAVRDANTAEAVRAYMAARGRGCDLFAAMRHAIDAGSFDLQASHAELVAAVDRLLALPVAIEELRMLGRGIGTATPSAAWLVARAALDNARKVTQ